MLGLSVGIVLDNKDRDGMHRIQVKYATPAGDIKSAWARQLTRMSGNKYGFTCLPEKDDEVFLRFVHGHPDLPVIVASVHNGKDKTPFDNGDGKNDLRLLWSRSGHKIEFFDGSGKESITATSTQGKTKMEMKTADKLIAATSTKDIVIRCPSGTLKVEAGKDLTLKASASWKLQASSNLDWKSDGSVTVKGSSGVVVKAPKVDVKA
jgi:uncharacterized protein involved in type VI secretion and phage assembly